MGVMRSMFDTFRAGGAFRRLALLVGLHYTLVVSFSNACHTCGRPHHGASEACKAVLDSCPLATLQEEHDSEHSKGASGGCPACQFAGLNKAYAVESTDEPFVEISRFRRDESDRVAHEGPASASYFIRAPPLMQIASSVN